VAEAHLAAANSNITLPPAMNVGTGIGTSVSQIIWMIQNITETRRNQVIFSERRQGDPAILTGEVQLIKDNLKFLTQYGIDQSIKDLAEALRESDT
jgi:UDP-glucose 4-epimerase